MEKNILWRVVVIVAVVAVAAWSLPGLAFAVFTRMPFGPRQLFYVFVTFIGLQLINVPLVTIRQVFTPDVMLGRVLTATRAIGWAPTPIGALIGASLVSAEVVSFITAVRLAPTLIILAGVGLVPTVIWSDTFGPIATGDHPTVGVDSD